MKLPGFCILSFTCLMIFAKSSAHGAARVVCYYTNWSIYRPDSAKYGPENINPYLCTHLIYAFGGFTKDMLKPFDRQQDIVNRGYAKYTGLKTTNKNLKTLLSIGGWNEGSTRFSSLVGDADKRRTFIKNAIIFLRQNEFDGLDLDWQYPTFRAGSKPTDRDNFPQFIQELREEFDRESATSEMSRLLLTVAIPASVRKIKQGYDLVKLNQYLDWFNVFTFNYHDSSEPVTNHHAPLYSLEDDLSVDFSVNYLINAGVDRQKLVFGIPTFGRSFKLFKSDATGIGAPANGPGDPGHTTKEAGLLAYYEVCQNIINDDNWTVNHPNDNMTGPYSYKDDQWISYDDENISRKKAQYAANHGLGGVMFWTIDTDDFNGTCSGKPYPLIEAAKESLYDALGIKITDPKETIISTAPQNRPTQTPTNSNEAPTNLAPEPPTMPDHGSDFICKEEGFFSHPRDCKKYFWCSTSSNFGIMTQQFTCPSDLVFNQQADSCDYARNVICENTQSSTATIKTPQTIIRLSATQRATTHRTATDRPTTTTSTTTSAYDDDDRENEDEVEDSELEGDDIEDPEVIKELVDLIKNTGDNLSIFRGLLKQKPQYVTIQNQRTLIKIVW